MRWRRPPGPRSWRLAGMSSAFPDDPAGEHDRDGAQCDDAGEDADQQRTNAEFTQTSPRLPDELDAVADQVERPIDDARLDPRCSAAHRQHDADRGQLGGPIDKESLPHRVPDWLQGRRRRHAARVYDEE